jgi:hypothetical protein
MHKWFFQGKVIKIIDVQTIILWIDLGFESWKKVRVKFNRIKSILPDTNTAMSFLEQNLKNKPIYCQIFKSKDYNGHDRYFAEIYTSSNGISLKLRDINKSISNSHRIEGLVNFNDIMVSHGFSIYIQFKRKNFYNEFPVYDRPPRQYSNVRNNFGNGIEQGNQTDTSRGGSSPQG